MHPPREFADALGELFLQVRVHFEQGFADLGVPSPCAKALRLIDGSLSMKELGARLHCDGSFVTAIADALEERGLARRETDPDDRRIKNLVLTRAGNKLRGRIQLLFDDFPGARRLDPEEREAFLRMLYKMMAKGVDAAAATPERQTAAS
ncbi:MAG TPA: MarR family transcriptional regulator [Candidatus Dormibacteraeota bacterium]|jgi:DNA-binding MarR family transcriptional regulator|nr:MarR family transcriptional regulator [Candidatus Dormibacteraeota bacterium]